MDIFFEVDINKCFNYSDTLVWIKNILDLEISKYFHRSESIAEFRKIYKNLKSVADEFFKWNQKRFKNPIDQYIYISKNTREIIDKIFKGVNMIGEEYYDIIDFRAGVEVYFKNFAHLPELALKHNFGEAIDDHFLANE